MSIEQKLEKVSYRKSTNLKEKIPSSIITERQNVDFAKSGKEIYRKVEFLMNHELVFLLRIYL